jgi:hypothetical protein
VIAKSGHGNTWDSARYAPADCATCVRSAALRSTTTAAVANGRSSVKKPQISTAVDA